MALFTNCLASFPNSRIKPRPPTQQSVTSKVTVPSGDAFGTNVLLAAANPNRTNLTFFNESFVDSFVYGYVDSADLGTAGAGADKGFVVPPRGSVEILDPGNIYAHNFTDGADILVDIDEGSG